MVPSSIRHKAIIFLACCLSVCGCGSSPGARFYVLRPVTQEMSGSRIAFPPDTLVALGPVVVPDYLDRPQVVMTGADNRITVSEFDRWGGALSSEISRTLRESLSAVLGKNVPVVSWRRHVPFSVRVAVEIIRFDLTPGEVRLKAQWTLYGKDGRQFLALRESSVNEPVTGGDVASGVAAMGKALSRLSGEIAVGLAAAHIGERPVGQGHENGNRD